MICAANRQTGSDKTSSEGRSDDRWPRLIKVGVHQVKIYRDTLPSGAVSYRVEDRSGPKRQLRRCETLQKAEQLARDIGRRLKNPALLTSMVSSTQAAEYLTLRRLAGHWDLTVLVPRAAEALKHLGGTEPKRIAIKGRGGTQ